ncbi:MAG: hypothetical protein P8L91_01225 [Candidatus Marinimicrobia bacterium]|nr:hypothetical protein [Candidatus Neomarinimicrobiota bacterium]
MQRTKKGPMMMIRKPIKQMTKKELVAYALTIEYLYFNLKDELEPLAHILPYVEKWKDHHAHTIKMYHDKFESEEADVPLEKLIYDKEPPKLKPLEELQQMIDNLDLTDNDRHILQVLMDCGVNQTVAAIPYKMFISN